MDMKDYEFIRKWRFMKKYCFPGGKKSYIDEHYILFANARNIRMRIQGMIMLITCLSLIVMNEIQYVNFFVRVLCIAITIIIDFIILITLLTIVLPIKSNDED